MRRRALLSKRDGEVPIMSFQTDKNGTFSPTINVSLGTLKWVIDGVEYITNSPSVALTGTTVDVEVFANDVLEDVNASQAVFTDDKIIGLLDFDYFTLTSLFLTERNPGLTNINISDNVNTLAFTDVRNCGIITLDLSTTTITGQLNVLNSPNLASITFSSNSNILSGLNASSCALTSLDLSNVQINGSCAAPSNSITSIVFNATGNSITNLSLSANSLSSLDLSNVTISNALFANNNSGLTSLTSPNYTTGIAFYDVVSCGLDVSSVNSIFSTLNTFFSSNTPIKNMTVTANGGTNASPTGGSSNTDLVNLRDVVYPNAGFTFTANIN